MGTDWLFPQGSANKPAKQPAPLRLQSSIDGKPIPIIWGCNRLAVNLIWAGDYTAVQTKTQGTASGGSSKSAGGGTSSNYNYFISAVLGICEGPISTITQFWVNKALFPGTYLTALRLSLFLGDYTQAAWSYLVSLHSGQDLGYRGTAYVAAQQQQLGTNPNQPNINAIILSSINAGATANVFDANPADIIIDALTNTKYGVGLPSARVGALTNYRNYCYAANLLLSPVLTEQRPLVDSLNEWAQATNSEFIWSAGQLTLVPYADGNVSANNVSYSASITPLYDLTDNDFISGKGLSSDAPIVCRCKRLEDVANSISLTFASGDYLQGGANPNTVVNVGAGSYDPAIVTAKDDASILAYGLRQGSMRQHSAITTQQTAMASAMLQLGREQVINTFEFRLGPKYILLEPMDLVTLTETNTGMSRLTVRIKEITENSDGTLDFMAEEFLGGSGTAPVYGAQAKQGLAINYNAAPGGTTTPLIWEPPGQLSNNQLQIWMAVAPATFGNWGGCEVWISYGADTNANYIKLGEISGQSAYGTFVGAGFPAFSSSLQSGQGPLIDTLHTITANFTKSQTALASTTPADMLSGNSLLYLDSPAEYLAYQTSTPTGTYTTNITNLNRGLYGSAAAAHSGTANIAVLDGQIFKINYTPDRIGTTVYFKLLSFNIYGAARQQLTDVGAHVYTIAGTSLNSALAAVTNFILSYNSGGAAQFTWDQVSDTRQPILYEIRKGASWAQGLSIGRFSQGPVPCPGNDTYFISAVCQPAPGLTVYSATQPSLVVAVTVLQQSLSLVNSFDEVGSSWSGGTAVGLSIESTRIRTALPLSTAVYTSASTLNAGAVKAQLVGMTYTGFSTVAGSTEFFRWYMSAFASGTGYTAGKYTAVPLISTSGSTDTGARATIVVGKTLTLSTGVVSVFPSVYGTSTGPGFGVHSTDLGTSTAGSSGTGFRITSTRNVFAFSDIFDSAGARYVSVQPEISISTDGVTFGAYQPFQPGIYNAWSIKARMRLISNDLDALAVCDAWTWFSYST